MVDYEALYTIIEDELVKLGKRARGIADNKDRVKLAYILEALQGIHIVLQFELYNRERS